MIPIVIGLILLPSIIFFRNYLVLPFRQNVPTPPQYISITPTVAKKITNVPLPKSNPTNIQPTKFITSVTKVLVTTTGKPVYFPLVTNTPIPTSAVADTTAPVFEWMTGPSDGLTVDFNSFCFPMKINDNVSKLQELQVHFSFDSSEWGGWTTNVAPCYQKVANGPHTFSVQAKDGAGNLSSTITRRFTVNTELYAVKPASPAPTSLPMPTSTPPSFSVVTPSN